MRKKLWFSSNRRGYITAAVAAVICFGIAIIGGAFDHTSATSAAHAESSQQ